LAEIALTFPTVIDTTAEGLHHTDQGSNHQVEMSHC